jgi:hypothetical protein
MVNESKKSDMFSYEFSIKNKKSKECWDLNQNSSIIGSLDTEILKFQELIGVESTPNDVERKSGDIERKYNDEERKSCEDEGKYNDEVRKSKDSWWITKESPTLKDIQRNDDSKICIGNYYNI